MSDPVDLTWRNALRAAALGLRDGDGALGQDLAHRLRFGPPLTAEERLDLALLVTDQILPERNGRPAGALHPSDVQIAAAIEYADRLKTAKRGDAEAIRAEIGEPLGVSAATVARWATEHRRNVERLDSHYEAVGSALDAETVLQDHSKKPGRLA